MEKQFEKQTEKDIVQRDFGVIHPFEFIGGSGGYTGLGGDGDAISGNAIGVGLRDVYVGPGGEGIGPGSGNIGPGGEAIGGSGDVIDDSADFFGMGTGAVIGRTDESIKEPGNGI